MTGSFNVTSVVLTEVVVPLTVKLPVTITLPLRVGLETIPTVIVSPDTEVSISLFVPEILRVSVPNRTPSSVPLSAAKSRVVDIAAVPASVNLP